MIWQQGSPLHSHFRQLHLTSPRISSSSQTTENTLLPPLAATIYLIE
uniref:Uncharacterized protein n=1 Tax=Arundo donax TaxID=35708 RepID=A0A0A9HKT8_ARUDO